MDNYTFKPSSPSGYSFTREQNYPLVAMSGITPISNELQSANVVNHERRTLGDIGPSPFNDGFDQNASMDFFLKRKVKIFEIAWQPDTNLETSFHPWTLWASDPAVKAKLNNYYLVKGNMKLTFYINGTPFQFGLVLASYKYIGYKQENDFDITSRSQRPHLWLNPTTCKGGEIDIPFFYPSNYFMTTLPQPTTDQFGEVYMESIVPLRQINANTAEATISVFAEMIDLKISGATRNNSRLEGPGGDGGLVAQSGKVPSYMPKTLKPVKNEPVANLANIDGHDPSKSLTVHQHKYLDTSSVTVGLPTEETDIAYLAQKESFVLDFGWSPTTLPGTSIFSVDVDPMVERRTQTNEGKTDTGIQYRQTSLSFASRPFSFWSGTIKMRFQIMASQYHRGRLAFIYDPMGPLDTDQPFNTTYHTIVDLAEGRDFTIDIPWQQEVPYKRLERMENYAHFSYGSGAINRTREGRRFCNNGVLYVIVVNSLSVPDGITQADIALSISAGDDYEVTNPDGLISEFHHTPAIVVGGGGTFASRGAAVTLVDGTATEKSISNPEEDTPKTTSAKKKKGTLAKVKDKVSGKLIAMSAVEKTPVEENNPEAETCENPGIGIEISAPIKHNFYFGESISSVLDLCKRFTYYRTLHTLTTAEPGMRRISYKMPMLPEPPGFTFFGPDDIGVPDMKYRYVGQSYINFFNQAYSGWKGSVKWKAVPQSASASCGASRLTGFHDWPSVDYREDTVVVLTDGNKPGVYARALILTKRFSGAGATITQSRTMDSLEFILPYTRPTRFTLTNYAGTANLADFDIHNTTDGYLLSLTQQADDENSVDTYVAAGPDFNLYGFIGAPAVYTYNEFPTPIN